MGAYIELFELYADILAKMDKRTYNYKVLDYILKHGSITSMEAFKEIGDTRLSSTISELRYRHAVPIDTTMVTMNGKTFGVYTLGGE